MGKRASRGLQGDLPSTCAREAYQPDTSQLLLRTAPAAAKEQKNHSSSTPLQSPPHLSCGARPATGRRPQRPAGGPAAQTKRPGHAATPAGGGGEENGTTKSVVRVVAWSSRVRHGGQECPDPPFSFTSHPGTNIPPPRSPRRPSGGCSPAAAGGRPQWPGRQGCLPPGQPPLRE